MCNDLRHIRGGTERVCKDLYYFTAISIILLSFHMKCCAGCFSLKLFIFSNLKHVLVTCELNSRDLDSNIIDISPEKELYNYGETYTYGCNSGYMNTSYIITCGPDGTWSPQPTCTQSE